MQTVGVNGNSPVRGSLVFIRRVAVVHEHGPQVEGDGSSVSLGPSGLTSSQLLLMSHRPHGSKPRRQLRLRKQPSARQVPGPAGLSLQS